MARVVPRSTFVRGLVSATFLIALNGITGSLRRIVSPLRSLAASTGVPVGNVKDIGTEGALSYTDPASGDPAVVVKLASGKYVSYDAVCTHAGCTVEYDPTQQLLQCPCHGSTFDPSKNGKAVVGPASDPLPHLAIRIGADGTVYALDGQVAPTSTPTPTSTPVPAPQWATYDRVKRTAHLRVDASFGDNNYNINGSKGGRFIFTVPLHSRVVVTFRNDSSESRHGLQVVPNKGSVLHGGKIPGPAFRGASVSRGLHGVSYGTKRVVSFEAGKTGQYLLVCPVHGHIARGEWAWLVVSRPATTATWSVKR